MWIVGATALVAVLAPGPGAGAKEPSGVARGDARYISYVHAQEAPEPRIWLDRGDDPVLTAGDRVRIYYRTEADAYVAILQIDTDGTTRMLYPRYPTENHYARAHRDYRLLFPRSAYWNVDERPGVGYFFMMTSPTPFDLTDFGYSNYGGGWDLSAVGNTVYSDPYVAMDDYVARLVPEWEFVDYGLDFISYDVGGVHEYPRFLCYQCHGFRPYNTWNPYRYSCVDFQVIVYDDPYYHPSRRYRSDRVVMVGPRNPTLPRFEFKERVVGAPKAPLTVVRRGDADRSTPQTTRRRSGPTSGRGRVAPPPVNPRPSTTTRRNPRDRSDSSGPTSGRGRAVASPAGRTTTRRPTLERRPVTPKASSPQTRRPGTQQRSRPSLQPRTAPPRTEAPRPSQTRPRQAPQPDRPRARRPDTRRSEPAARAPARPSTRRSPVPSGGSSSSRPAPRSSTRRPPPSSGGSAARLGSAPTTSRDAPG